MCKQALSEIVLLVAQFYVSYFTTLPNIECYVESKMF